jgi:hypothetical protein
VYVTYSGYDDNSTVKERSDSLKRRNIKRVYLSTVDKASNLVSSTQDDAGGQILKRLI